MTDIRKALRLRRLSRPHDGKYLGYAAAAMRAGCAGLAIGRRVFTDPAPRGLAVGLSSAVHQGIRRGAHADHPITTTTGAA